MFKILFYQPIHQALYWLTSATNNLGISIILLTLGIRGILIPFSLPGIKAASKMRELKPDLDEIKKKYSKDKTKQQQKQLELFQKHQVNPASGCLPQIIQLVVLISLYRVFIDLLNNGLDSISSTSFLWLDLSQPDKTYILPVVTGIAQLLLGLMVLPATSTSADKTLAVDTKTKKDDQSAGDMSQMANTMQQQMVFVMPFMTALLATRFPSGLALYWVISTVFSLTQQYIVSGPGGLKQHLARIKSFKIN